MLYFLSITKRCNLRCKYCGESESEFEDLPKVLDENIDDTIDFLMKDPDPTISFYGGEPFLNIPIIMKVMDSLPKAKFLVQTNGILLNKLDSSYMNRFNTVLISIDGLSKITNFYRGKGTFQSIRKNLGFIVGNEFKGDLVARMTISHKSDIYRDVLGLLSLEKPSFNHIHWQLDVIWSDYVLWDDFDKWVSRSYNPGITKLVNRWIGSIEKEMRIEGIVPFLGIMNSLLLKKPSELRCGAGIESFTIQTDGNIYACPVCPEFEDFIVGNVKKSHPKNLYRSLGIKEPCPSCDVFSICGGRCLFVNHHNFWGESQFQSVCTTVKHLIAELERIKPRIQKIIKSGDLSISDFNYPKFNNSCEIIP